MTWQAFVESALLDGLFVIAVCCVLWACFDAVERWMSHRRTH